MPAKADILPSREAAIDAAIDEIRRCLLSRVYVCAEVFAVSGRVNVYEIRRGRSGDRKLTRRFRWDPKGAK